MAVLDIFFAKRQRELEVASSAYDRALAKLEGLGDVYAVVELDAQGYFTDANERFLKAVRYRRSELIGQHHRVLVAEDEVRSDAYEAFWADLRAGRGKAAEFKRIRKDGSPIRIRAAYCPVRGPDGQVDSVIKLALDVTVERDAVDRSQALVEMSLGGDVLDANDKFLDMVGYSMDELRGQHHRSLVDASFARSAAYQEHWRRLRNGEFISGTFERLRKDGSKVYMQASYNPVFDQDGQPQKIVKYATDVTRLRSSVEGIQEAVKSLGSSTSSLAASSSQLTSTAASTREQATSMQARSDEISAAMQSVSAATEELSSSVAEIAQTSALAAEEGRAGEAAAEAATLAVAQLGAVSERISSVVKLIKDIADQTNLLALNATIEAASAGSAGRGFMVVADEVKALSNETAKATGRISDEISAFVRISTSAGESVRELSSAVKGLSERQTTLAATAEEQGAVTTEIAAHAGRVATSMGAAAGEVASLTSSAEYANTVSEGVESAVQALSGVAERLAALAHSLSES